MLLIIIVRVFLSVINCVYPSGDYAVLIKSGIHWFTALLFNFLSALTAILGLFIGVAISQQTATANQWILAITAGLFLYIGLVDLVSSDGQTDRQTRENLALENAL